MTDPTPASDASGTYDASDPEQIEKAKKAAQQREQEHRNIEAELLDSKPRREWVWAVLRDLHVFEQRLPMSGSEYEAGILNGEREAGLRLMRRLARSNPTGFAKMLSENDRG